MRAEACKISSVSSRWRCHSQAAAARHYGSNVGSGLKVGHSHATRNLLNTSSMTTAHAPSIREVIHSAAHDAPSGAIDDAVHVSTELCMFLLASGEGAQTQYVDVPVDRIIAIGRSNLAKEGDTWRTVVSRLHCDGWTGDVFSYFDSPLLEQSFPAQASAGVMKLIATGGACQVSNGNHRIVAGRAWLTAKYGNTAAWKQAEVLYTPLGGPARQILERAARAETGVRVCQITSDEKYLEVAGEVARQLVALSDCPTEIYALGSDKLLRLQMPWSVRIRKTLDHTWYGKQRWHQIPAEVVKLMLDDTWITPQMARETAQASASP